jgi:hypothetical protein
MKASSSSGALANGLLNVDRISSTYLDATKGHKRAIMTDSTIGIAITNSIVAPYDHRLRLIGEEGCLQIAETWDYASPVTLRLVAQSRLSRILERRFGGAFCSSRLKPARTPLFRGGHGRPTMDFMRGVAELASAVREGCKCRIDEDFSMHVTEVTELLQYLECFDRPATVLSTFTPIEPMDWAR